ncbi:MAG: MBL fold metallo-hydrolase [Roseburia sp.]
MKVLFVHHSCFVVEAEEKVLIFDWFGECGALPEYDVDTPLYVLASHSHGDHFDRDILHWAKRYPNIHYILSKDCKMSPNFLKRHGFAEDIGEKITYVRAGERYEVEGVSIETLRSTDEGVAFYVTVGDTTLYHAGDLNDWYWEGEEEGVNEAMTRDYQREITKLTGKKIKVAFVPFDPRLQQHQSRGMDYFIKNTDWDCIFPMHMWGDYSAIVPYKRECLKFGEAERIMNISHRNQVFET